MEQWAKDARFYPSTVKKRFFFLSSFFRRLQNYTNVTKIQQKQMLQQFACIVFKLIIETRASRASRLGVDT